MNRLEDSSSIEVERTFVQNMLDIGKSRFFILINKHQTLKWLWSYRKGQLMSPDMEKETIEFIDGLREMNIRIHLRLYHRAGTPF